MNILMVLTSHDTLGSTGQKTGFWLEEFAAPNFVFCDAGAHSTLASPKGGQPPLDPKSDLPENQTPAMTRFKQDLTAQKALSQTVKFADVKSEDYDTVFYPGGHGPTWDLAESPVSIALLESFYNSGKPIALVCHSPGVLRHVTYQGAPLVRGKRVSGFTNGEEEEMHLSHVVPFLVEDELLRLGGIFGLNSATQKPAIESARDRFRFYAVAPGVVDTPMHRDDLSDSTLQPALKKETVEDTVNAALYLAQAGYASGEILHVDGAAPTRRW
jgi:putative intracellular protease/amidase